MHYRTIFSVNRQVQYANNPNRCKECNQDLSYDQRTNKFCSKQCTNKFYSISDVRVKPVKIEGETWFTRKCPTCKKTLYHTRKINAIRIAKENRECKCCAKSHISNTTKQKRLKSHKKTIARLRKLKNY